LLQIPTSVLMSVFCLVRKNSKKKVTFVNRWIDSLKQIV
jgi:hypothetical protein